jgi:hypothetical protein
MTVLNKSILSIFMPFQVWKDFFDTIEVKIFCAPYGTGDRL